MPRHPHREPGQRALRVGEELRHALARLFERGDLKDPDLAGVALTVTEVRLSPDLKNATAFVMPLAGANAAQVMAGLKRSTPYIRRSVAQSVALRYAPAIVFSLDTAFEHAQRIDRLLHRPEVARDLAAPAGDGEPREGEGD